MILLKTNHPYLRMKYHSTIVYVISSIRIIPGPMHHAYVLTSLTYTLSYPSQMTRMRP
jgi:hypothetical protein